MVSLEFVAFHLHLYLETFIRANDYYIHSDLCGKGSIFIFYSFYSFNDGPGTLVYVLLAIPVALAMDFR